jgi:organic radical activating enzyme
MNTKMIEYQMFTTCNLKCSYCYNYFDQSPEALETHIADLRKISSLADEKTCMVVNGGEPLLLKELATLINSIEVETNVITYSNGTLPLKVYEKFVNEVRKDNLYFTVSVHYAELLRTNNVNEAYINNVRYLINNLPNFKINIVFTEDFADADFLAGLTKLIKEFEAAGLKNVNILLEDSLKEKPFVAVKLINTPQFKEFFEQLQGFKYKHCMWNNKDDSISCLQLWLRKEVMSPPLPYKEMSFLRKGNKYVFESNFGFTSDLLDGDMVSDLDMFVEQVRPELQ